MEKLYLGGCASTSDTLKLIGILRNSNKCDALVSAFYKKYPKPENMQE